MAEVRLGVVMESLLPSFPCANSTSVLTTSSPADRIVRAAQAMTRGNSVDGEAGAAGQIVLISIIDARRPEATPLMPSEQTLDWVRPPSTARWHRLVATRGRRARSTENKSGRVKLGRFSGALARGWPRGIASVGDARGPARPCSSQQPLHPRGWARVYR